MAGTARRVGGVAVGAALAFGASSVLAQDACEPVVGRLASVEGEVEVQRSDAGAWQPGNLSGPLCEGDSIRTGARSRAAVALINEAVLRVDESTTLRLIDIVEEEDGTSFLELVRGIFQSFSRSPRELAIDTPYMNATIEGTEFVLEVAENQSSVTVLEGVVAVENDQGAARVASGQAAVAEAGQAPRQVTVVTPRDAVQWSLYYPPIIAVQATPGAGLDPELTPALQRALELAGEGRTGAALSALDEVPEPDRDAAWHVYRASLLLSVGEVAAAELAIERALALDPQVGTAHALRAIIHVVQNEEQEALVAARRGVEVSPEASAPKVALSYALQATFDLEAARDVLLDAIRQDPDNPLLWARLAELHLSLGGRSEAREAAARAVELAQAQTASATAGTPVLTIRLAAFTSLADAPQTGPPVPFDDLAQAAPVSPAPAPPRVRSPELERALVVLGFADLAEFDTAAARENFARAIELDPADPLPHFGYGLAQIRDGELEDGRQNIEVAVALDSSSSVLRSYLGKAYFEEKRNELAARQYEIAKVLDPQDPTAYLYDAIRKQTEGRPVEALEDLQRSIELNDNRAVYRSRLQLDEDRAARGTSLARIYDDLGFQELGLKEATRSVTADPTNASAHRFLSDVYGGIRRREIARVSELFQAQMLQHININPVQPSASETNLNIVTSGGPTEVGFNEFTPLFERDQAQLNASGVVGSDDALGGEAVVSGLYDRFSISAGAFHFETDGWRENHLIDHDIYNFFFQAAITPELNAQVELRRRNTELGDLDLTFDPDQFFPNFRSNLDEDTARLGLRYSPVVHSDFLLSFIYSDREESQQDDFETVFGPGELSADGGDDGYQLEGQYLFRQDIFNIVVGGAHNDFDGESDVFLSAGPIVLVDVAEESKIRQTRGYGYGTLNLPAPVTWTAGLSYDDLETESLDLDELNPKFGVQWNVTDDLRLRGAVFQTVKPALATNRSLEPTQVAGFNQLFDDNNGTKSLRYGVGADYRARDGLFFGIEATQRELDSPFFDDALGRSVTVDDKEQNVRGYANWTPRDEWAFAAELVYDRFTSERSLRTVQGNVPEELVTFSVPVSVRYFHGSGFFAGGRVIYVDQDVDRSPGQVDGLAEGQDNFFVLDASVGYRFPNRFGTISFEVSNLLDTEFNYQDDSFREFGDEPSIGPYIPERQFLARATLNW